jgi:hypothetical protein
MESRYRMYEMLIKHRTALWDAIVAEWPSIDILKMVSEQRKQWGELLQQIEKEES